MNARGTRRPHPRRVRSKPMRRVGKSSSGCALVLVAMAVLPAVVLALVTR